MVKRSGPHIFLSLLLLVLLSACETQPTQPLASERPAVALAKEAEGAPPGPARNNDAAHNNNVVLNNSGTQQHLEREGEGEDEPAIKKLLAAAESALLVDQLTSPEYDNAYDRYRAVLLLSPGHSKALEGLIQIQLRYVEMSREALRHQRFSQAQAYWSRAASIAIDNFPGNNLQKNNLQKTNPQNNRLQENNALLNEVKDEIEQARRQYAKRHPQAAPEAASFNGREMTFDARALSHKEDSVVSRLQDLAVKIRESGETLLIVARSDAEGRWMYRMMKEAVPGYRLRGDIKVGRTPKIQLLPPIE